MSAPGGRLLHLAAAVDLPWDGAPRIPAQSRGEGGSGGRRGEAGDVTDVEADAYVELARLAESGGLDFVTFDWAGARSAPSLLARVASATGRIGLVATLADGDAGPLADLDRACRDRGGWRPGPEQEQEPESGESVGGELPGRALVRLVDITGPRARRTAARRADVALVRAVSPAQAAEERTELRSLAAEFGRDPESLRVLAALRVDLGGGECAAEPAHGGGGPRPSAHGPLYRGGPVGLAALIAAWHGTGAVDGFHLTSVEPRRDLERLVNGTVALLQHRGLFRTFYPGSTLREHLGLARPAPRRTTARQAP